MFMTCKGTFSCNLQIINNVNSTMKLKLMFRSIIILFPRPKTSIIISQCENKVFGPNSYDNDVSTY